MRAHKVNWVIDKIGLAVIGFFGIATWNDLHRVIELANLHSTQISTMQQWAKAIGDAVGVHYY
jgi:hypothetical protein